MGTRIFLAMFIVLGLANCASAQGLMELRWNELPKKGAQASSYQVHIGTESRNYQRHRKFPGMTLAVNIEELPLETGAPNFISATKNGIPVFSTEIVILWTADLPDSDQDGLSDQLEQKLGTDPQKQDSDEDGLPDGEEYAAWGPNKWNLDFDEDGTANLLDRDSDGDGLDDGSDPDIRKLPPVFICSQEQLAEDEKAFIELVANRKLQSDFRSGTESITINWEERPERSVRMRVYSTTETLPEEQQREFEQQHGYLNAGAYDYTIWEGETKGTKLVVEKLEKGVTYHFVLRALNPAGEISGPSPEKKVTIPH